MSSFQEFGMILSFLFSLGICSILPFPKQKKLLMGTRNYEGMRFDRQELRATLDTLSVEEALQININNKAFTVTMRTPDDDKYLVRGLLHSEGILTNPNFIPEIKFRKERHKSAVTIADLRVPVDELGVNYNNSRSLLSVTSCGICGKTELDELSSCEEALDHDQSIDIEVLHNLFAQMNEEQHNFHKSGGTHAAMAFTINGEALCAMEDIGRHNAVDKVVGQLIMDGSLEKASCLTVSGRISYEIVVKCFKAGIPVLAAVSAPSSLAVDYAKELGLTLFAFCRDGRATCYANPQNIEQGEEIIKASI